MSNYTLSNQAYLFLTTTLCKPPSKVTVWRRQHPEQFLDGFNRVRTEAPAKRTTTQGLSNALRLLSYNYDLQEWTAKPDRTTSLYYNPVDSLYLQQTQQGLDDDPDFLSNNELLDYQLELDKVRKQHSLALDPSTTAYYSNLLIFLRISLPTRPSVLSPWIARQHDNLTTRVSFCLEAIGTKHILLPAGYQYTIQQPNAKLDRSVQRKEKQALFHHHYLPKPKTIDVDVYTATDRSSQPFFGNHDHVDHEYFEWKPLPSATSKYTQAHVDYCCHPKVKLEDLAYQACQENPSLVYKPQRKVPTKLVNIPGTAATSNDRVGPKRPKLYNTDNTEPVYAYNGRDVTPAVLEAYNIVYTLDFNFKATLAIQKEYRITYNVLRVLVHREHIRRLMATPTPTPTPTPVEVLTNG